MLSGTPKESKSYLIIGITGMEVESSQVTGAWRRKGAFFLYSTSVIMDIML